MDDQGVPSSQHALLKLPEQSADILLPIIKGTEGPSAIDVRNLFQDTGYYTYDPGFGSTATCLSAISHIEGDKGVLLYRGHPIESLITYSFLEVAYLIREGQLPTPDQRAAFEREVTHHTLVHEQIFEGYGAFSRQAAPMTMLMSALSALSAYYEAQSPSQSVGKDDAIRLIAKMPTLVATIYKYKMGHPSIYPRNDLDYENNFLYMLFGLPTEDYYRHPLAIQALKTIFILHAEHGQNPSTSAMRLVASSGTNLFGAAVAATASLWGPAHGGANEAVMNMLKDIQKIERVADYIEQVKQKKYRLMGFGHRIYKTYDPRAAILKNICHGLLNNKDFPIEQPLFDLALALEEVALKDDYFIERRLYPNVDFYSGLIFSALKIPIWLFTPLFAMSRSVGWSTHFEEMRADTQGRIYRPCQVYCGPPRVN